MKYLVLIISRCDLGRPIIEGTTLVATKLGETTHPGPNIIRTRVLIIRRWDLERPIIKGTTLVGTKLVETTHPGPNNIRTRVLIIRRWDLGRPNIGSYRYYISRYELVL